MQYRKELREVANNHKMTLKDFLKFLEKPDLIKTGKAKKRWKKERAK